MTKNELHAYIAGILDGEAYIGIKKSTWGMRNRTDVKCPTYSERVQVRMVCRPILELIKAEFGGSLGTERQIYQSKTGFTGRKIMSCYRASDKVAASLIKATRKYLIEKCVQADCVLALRKNKDTRDAKRRGSPAKRLLKESVLAEREKLWLRCKELHKH